MRAWPADLDEAPLASDADGPALRRPFFLSTPASPNARTGVLLVHGFTGTPFEMRPFGELLARHGYTVYGPRLAGHGETSEVLRESTFEHWVASVDAAFERLQTRVDRICVCGLSLGGLITLDLARRRPKEIAAIQVLSAPLWLSRWPELAIKWTNFLGRSPAVIIPKGAGSDIADRAMHQRNFLAGGAIGLPIRAVLSLRKFMELVRLRLPDVHVPALLAHGRNDHTAPYACLAALAAELGSTDKQTLTLERSFHVVTLDHDRVQLADAVAAHVAAHTTS